MAEEEGLQRATPWLSDFAGGFWAGLEPMFLLTFLIATLGALCFMCVLRGAPTQFFLTAVTSCSAAVAVSAACWPQRRTGLDSSPRCGGDSAGKIQARTGRSQAAGSDRRA